MILGLHWGPYFFCPLAAGTHTPNRLEHPASRAPQPNSCAVDASLSVMREETALLR